MGRLGRYFGPDAVTRETGLVLDTLNSQPTWTKSAGVSVGAPRHSAGFIQPTGSKHTQFLA